MSVKVMAWVWDHSQARERDRLVLLAIADHCDHDGSNAWPKLETLAAKVACSVRTVQRSIRALVDLGELEVEVNAGGSRDTRPDHRPNRYRIVMDGTTLLSPRPTPRGDNGAAYGVTRLSSRGVTRPSPPIKEPSVGPILEPSARDRRSLDADLEAGRGFPSRRRLAGEVKGEVLRRRQVPASELPRVFELALEFLEAGWREDELVEAMVGASCLSVRAVEVEREKRRRDSGDDDPGRVERIAARLAARHEAEGRRR